MPRFGTFANQAVRCAAHFRAHRGGSVAVEFAFVALPFFALLFAIAQTSLALFTNQALQVMVANASRLIMTGEAAGQGIAEFKNRICDPDDPPPIFDCSKLLVQVQSFPDFSTADPNAFVTDDCFDLEKAEGASCYNPGGAKDVVIVRVAYEWPLSLGFVDAGKQLLVSVSAFKSEPY